MKKLALALMLVAGNVFAQPYIEAGVGASIGGCLHRWRPSVTPGPSYVECTKNPFSTIAFGYQYGPFRLAWEHSSAPMDSKDRGMETVSIKYKIEFK